MCSLYKVTHGTFVLTGWQAMPSSQDFSVKDVNKKHCNFLSELHGGGGGGGDEGGFCTGRGSFSCQIHCTQDSMRAVVLPLSQNRNNIMKDSIFKPEWTGWMIAVIKMLNVLMDMWNNVELSTSIINTSPPPMPGASSGSHDGISDYIFKEKLS